VPCRHDVYAPSLRECSAICDVVIRFLFFGLQAIMLFLNMRTTLGQDPWETVPAGTIYQIFEDVVKLAGFHMARKGVLARQVSADLIHLINLTRFKGALYGFRWGVSLSYVPHRWENKLLWHRSIRSAALDLWDQLADLPPRVNFMRVRKNSSIPSGLHGRELFEQNLRREWREIESTISQWLDSVSDLSGVLSMSAKQMERVWTGPSHFPPPSLVHAFTLARMGHSAEAEAELKAIADAEIPKPNSLLFQALQKVAAQS
jgi:hypothetical protein